MNPGENLNRALSEHRASLKCGVWDCPAPVTLVALHCCTVLFTSRAETPRALAERRTTVSNITRVENVESVKQYSSWFHIYNRSEGRAHLQAYS